MGRQMRKERKTDEIRSGGNNEEKNEGITKKRGLNRSGKKSRVA